MKIVSAILWISNKNLFLMCVLFDVFVEINKKNNRLSVKNCNVICFIALIVNLPQWSFGSHHLHLAERTHREKNCITTTTTMKLKEKKTLLNLSICLFIAFRVHSINLCVFNVAGAQCYYSYYYSFRFSYISCVCVCLRIHYYFRFVSPIFFLLFFSSAAAAVALSLLELIKWIKYCYVCNWACRVRQV